MNKFKLFLIIISCFILGGITKTIVFGQTAPYNLIEACEKRNGLIYAFNDGFSTTHDCTSDSRKIYIGPAVPNTIPNAALMYAMNPSDIYLLMNDKSVWNYSFKSWKLREDLPPVPVLVTDIAQWSFTLFITKSGEVWRYDWDVAEWISLGGPTLTP